jgi:predicted nucleic acid-binding protein
MLVTALNFSNNAMVVLLREFIDSCKTETIAIASATNGFVTTDTDIQ